MINIVHEVRLDRPFAGNTGAFKASDCFMNALTQCMVSKESFTTIVVTFVIYQKEKNEEASCLQRALDRKLKLCNKKCT